MTTPTILMADDDLDDHELVRDAMEQTELANELRCVGSGEQLLDYLHRRGQFDALTPASRPGVILLDVDMPGLDGFETLRAIKATPALRDIPIVMLSTSRAEADVRESYELGASSYVQKPATFPELVAVLHDIGEYWFQTVILPGPRGAG